MSRGRRGCRGQQRGHGRGADTQRRGPPQQLTPADPATKDRGEQGHLIVAMDHEFTLLWMVAPAVGQRPLGLTQRRAPGVHQSHTGNSFVLIVNSLEVAFVAVNRRLSAISYQLSAFGDLENDTMAKSKECTDHHSKADSR
jgi:hypothetical protein